MHLKRVWGWSPINRLLGCSVSTFIVQAVQSECVEPTSLKIIKEKQKSAAKDFYEL